jgi:ABC-type uncharacterized transport system substrate-binding protein
MVLASYGVNYHKVGNNVAKMVVDVLRGNEISKIQPIYPGAKDHRGFISRKNADEFEIKIPDDLNNTIIVE